MVKLERDATITAYVQLVEELTPKQDTTNNHDNCFIAGWGNTVGKLEPQRVPNILCYCVTHAKK